MHQKVGDRVRVKCSQCASHTSHIVLASKDLSGTEPDVDIRWWDAYQIIQCGGCETVSFRKASSNTENVEPNGELAVEEALYPDPASQRRPIDGNQKFPATTRRVYLEVLKALSHGAPLLAAIGLRALIESICRERKTSKGDLAQRIDELVGQGLLSRRQADFLHTHRFLSNVAAHEIRAPDQQELLAALDIAETVLKTIYVLPGLAASIRTGRARRRQKSKTPEGSAPSGGVG